jgi:hypothetical protein
MAGTSKRFGSMAVGAPAIARRALEQSIILQSMIL